MPLAVPRSNCATMTTSKAILVAIGQGITPTTQADLEFAYGLVVLVIFIALSLASEDWERVHKVIETIEDLLQGLLVDHNSVRVLLQVIQRSLVWFLVFFRNDSGCVVLGPPVNELGLALLLIHFLLSLQWQRRQFKTPQKPSSETPEKERPVEHNLAHGNPD